MAKSASTYGIAWQYKQVTVREIAADRPVARCIDTEGQYLDAAMTAYWTGVRPQVGQTWLVDRELGVWTFRALLWLEGADPLPPEPQTGSWEPLVLSGGWAASTDPNDPPPEARVTADGVIEVAGVITGGTVPTSGSLVVASLPEGFPDCYRVNAVLAASLTGSSAYIRGAVTAEGAVTITSSSSTYAPAWIDLSALRARVRT